MWQAPATTSTTWCLCECAERDRQVLVNVLLNVNNKINHLCDTTVELQTGS